VEKSLAAARSLGSRRALAELAMVRHAHHFGDTVVLPMVQEMIKITSAKSRRK